MLNNVIRFVANLLVSWCDRTGRTHHITGASDELYLIRYIVLKTKFFSVFIHRFMRSDEPVPHDHPWNFLTYVISGGYLEQLFDRARPKHNDAQFTAYWSQTTVIRLPGSLKYRSSNAIHYVDTDRKYELSEIEKAPFTICLIGRRVKEWGFWVDDTTYVDWREFLKIRSVNDRRIEGSE